MARDGACVPSSATPWHRLPHGVQGGAAPRLWARPRGFGVTDTAPSCVSHGEADLGPLHAWWRVRCPLRKEQGEAQHPPAPQLTSPRPCPRPRVAPRQPRSLTPPPRAALMRTGMGCDRRWGRGAPRAQSASRPGGDSAGGGAPSPPSWGGGFCSWCPPTCVPGPHRQGAGSVPLWGHPKTGAGCWGHRPHPPAPPDSPVGQALLGGEGGNFCKRRGLN